MSAPMTREDVESVVAEARRRCIAPNLRGANLRYADLRGALLRDTNLRGADLRGADLRDSDLRGSDLRGADLRCADLRDTNLRGADLRGADLVGILLAGIPSGYVQYVPTTDGWHLRIGCWTGTTTTLRDLVNGNGPWPEATGPEKDRRRPMLLAVADMCDAYAAAHPDAVAEVQAAAARREAQS